MNFFLGTHMIGQPWWDLEIPLFVSRQRLIKRKKTLPVARAPWALDSGGFTELSRPPHHWTLTEDEYVREVLRWQQEIGQLAWVAPMDHMCEPFILAHTGFDVVEHQRRTVDNFIRLRERLGPLVVPVLQGWEVEDYMRCWERYEDAGVALEDERVVGVGSVCRRQDTHEGARILRSLRPLRLHGFGVKISGLTTYGDELVSADSMAWSYRARLDYPMRGCTHKSCQNCLRYALRWRDELLARLGQLKLPLEAPA